MNKKIDNKIKKLELELLNPDVRKNTIRLKELIANDFFEFSEAGVCINKRDVLKRLPKFDEVKWTTYNFKTKEISPGITLATYGAQKKTLKNGEKKWSLRSSLWQDKNGILQMIFHQGTALSEESIKIFNQKKD